MEDLVQFLPKDGQGLLRRELPGVQLGLVPVGMGAEREDKREHLENKGHSGAKICTGNAHQVAQIVSQTSGSKGLSE